jgi:hypothetical protein
MELEYASGTALGTLDAVVVSRVEVTYCVAVDSYVLLVAVVGGTGEVAGNVPVGVGAIRVLLSITGDGDGDGDGHGNDGDGVAMGTMGIGSVVSMMPATSVSSGSDVSTGVEDWAG